MIQEKSKLTLFLVAFSSILLLGIIIGSVTFVYLYQRLVNERNVFAREAAHLSQELKRRIAVPAEREAVINENGTRTWKVFLNEGALRFRFLYPTSLYFDLSSVVEPLGKPESVFYGCFSNRLPPGFGGRETEPYWCLGDVSVTQAPLSQVVSDYQQLKERVGDLIPEGTLLGVEVVQTEVQLTSQQYSGLKVHIVRTIRTDQQTLTETSREYVVPHNDFVYIFRNGGIAGKIDDQIFNNIVESIEFLQ